MTKLAQGSTTQLQLTVLPMNATNKSVVWSSSNTSIAEVSSNGIVTGKNAGIASITATAADGSAVSGSYEIMVVKHRVTKITLQSSTKGVAAGKSTAIMAKIKTNGTSANKSLEWNSSNQEYATVNSKGIVTTKKAGAGKTVVITASATDGSGVTAKISVRILASSVKRITLKCRNKTIKAGQKVTVKATVRTTGKNANKNLQWSSSNKKYAMVNSKGVVTAKKAGKGKSVSVTAKATDGSKKKAAIRLKIR